VVESMKNTIRSRIENLSSIERYERVM